VLEVRRVLLEHQTEVLAKWQAAERDAAQLVEQSTPAATVVPASSTEEELSPMQP
jgi:hypothetical protein